MMNFQFVLDLADLIAQNTPNSIVRQLRIHASQRQRHTENSLPDSDARQRQHQLLLTANYFFERETIAVENWRHSKTCFQQLANCFEGATSIPDHKQLSIFSWYLQIDTAFGFISNSSNWVALGRAFASEPYKFAGFICWLVEKNVSIDVIHSSGLLQRYFEYHVIELDILRETYTLIETLSEKTALFSQALHSTVTTMRGFYNQQQEDGSFRSYNVKGERFRHYNKYGDFDRPSTTVLPIYLNVLCDVAPLFEMFGWELIQALNFNYFSHKDLFAKLLFSSVQRQILDELPQFALMQHDTFGCVESMLSIIRTRLVEQRAIPSDAALINLIQSNPFYIQLLDPQDILNNDELRAVLAKRLNDCISQVNYQSYNSLLFWIRLVKKRLLSNDDEIQSRMINMLWDIVCRFERSLSDDEVDYIQLVSAELSPMAMQKTNECMGALDHHLDAFHHGHIDFQAVYDLWGSQLSYMNLSRFLFQISAFNYPYEIYELYSKVLIGHHRYCIAMQRAYDVGSLLSMMTHDTQKKIRILQETLLHGSFIEKFVDVILQYLKDENMLFQCIAEPFGVQTSLLFYSFSRPNSLLFHRFMALMPFDTAVIIHLFKTAVETRRWEFYKHFLDRFEISKLIRNQLIDMLLANLKERRRDTSAFQFLFSQLCVLVNNSPPNAIERDNLIRIFDLGIELQSPTLIEAVCSTKGKCCLPASVIHNGIEQLLKQGDMKILGLLCGLERNVELNPHVFNKTRLIHYLTIAIRYSQIVGSNDKNYLFKYVNSNHENLLYIAANHCHFDEFVRCCNEFRKRFSKADMASFLEMETVKGKKVYALGETHDYQKINQYIQKLRDEYIVYAQSALITRRSGFFRIRSRTDDESDDPQLTQLSRPN